MKNVMEANLQWRKSEEGGRQSPPPGPRYSSVAWFEDQKESWRKEAWSLVIEIAEPPDDSLSHRVRVSFLADGPDELLRPGRVFELMEGRRAVAKGTMAA
jgi:hypothetical protein